MNQSLRSEYGINFDGGAGREGAVCVGRGLGGSVVWWNRGRVGKEEEVWWKRREDDLTEPGLHITDVHQC